MKMNARQKKAMLALYKQGMGVYEIANNLNVMSWLIELELGKELAIERALQKPESELNPEPKKNSLKWTICKYGSNNNSSFPNDNQIVLAMTNTELWAVCVFDAKSKDFILNPIDDPLYDEPIYLYNVYAWMPLPNAPVVPHIKNDEYLIEQTALETFDIIDAITPALRDAVKHLLVQQGANK